MARIIDLKNRKPQSEPAPQSRLAKPQVEVAGIKTHRFVGPIPVQQSTSAMSSVPNGSGLKPQEIPPPSQVTPGPKTQVIGWSGPLYNYQPDLKAIVAVSLTLFAIAVLVQIFQKNIITTIFFSLLGVVILIRAGKKPEVVDFEINPLGVKVGGQLYGFREIKSFWIEYDPALDIKELSLQLKKWHRAYVKIPIYDQNPVQLRLILLSFLPEVEHKDTLTDAVSRRLGL